MDFNIHEIIDNAMKSKDRYVTIYCSESGTSVNVYPITDYEDDCNTEANIRCKDCARYQAVTDESGNCYLTTTIMHPIDFCSRARRK